jgi:hypothetical protein
MSDDAADSTQVRTGAAEGAVVDEPAVREQAVAAAAAELADRLKELAGRLGSALRPRRVQFGKGRFGGSLKRRSPEGFVLDAVNLQMLLPDGRLWSYSRSDAIRYPAGRYFDIRADHTNFARGRSFFGGRGFTFLGAVLGKYTFGLADGDGRDRAAGALCAICTEGKSIRYTDVTKALADIAGSVVPRGQAG